MKGDRDIAVLVVDDEEPARLLMREMIERLPGYRLAGEAADGFEAIRLAAELSPGVALLDVEMPGLDGFEVAEVLDPSIAVVFVTAYDRYAVKAFEIHAVDYLLKPFHERRLAEALGRARARDPNLSAGAVSASLRGEEAYCARVVVRDGASAHVIPVERLDLAESQDDYVALKSGGRIFLKPQTLSALAALLDPARFVRVHRSYLVNLDRVASIEQYSKNSHAAILTDGSRIPVSRAGHARLKDALAVARKSRLESPSS